MTGYNANPGTSTSDPQLPKLKKKVDILARLHSKKLSILHIMIEASHEHHIIFYGPRNGSKKKFWNPIGQEPPD